MTRKSSLFQCSLFLGVFDELSIDGHTLALADAVHVPLCHIVAVRLLAQILQFFFSSGDPEWVLIVQFIPGQNFQRRLPRSEGAHAPAKYELRTGCARCPFPNVCVCLNEIKNMPTTDSSHRQRIRNSQRRAAELGR